MVEKWQTEEEEAVPRRVIRTILRVDDCDCIVFEQGAPRRPDQEVPHQHCDEPHQPDGHEHRQNNDLALGKNLWGKSAAVDRPDAPYTLLLLPLTASVYVSALFAPRGKYNGKTRS